MALRQLVWADPRFGVDARERCSPARPWSRISAPMTFMLSASASQRFAEQALDRSSYCLCGPELGAKTGLRLNYTTIMK
jgi:hypothetical protein